MKFSSYISVSIILHMTLTLLLGMVSYSDKTSANIFNVDVVAPFEPIKPEEVLKSKPFLKKRKKPVLVKKQRPPDKNIQPNTLFDDNTGPESKDKSRSALSDSTNLFLEQAHKTNGKKPVTALQKEDDNTKPGEQAHKTNGKESVTALQNENVNPQSEKDTITTIPSSALFDRKTIDKFARKRPDKDKGLTFEAPEFKNRGYMRLLREKIENIWKYPRKAATLGRSGDLYILFSIKKDGRLGNVELIRTSGHRELDEAAIKALKDAQPYWPLPDNWESDELEINGHFIYVYGATYLL